LNPKSKLFVLREPALTLLPKLFKAWKISHLVFEKDVDAYGAERDEQVKKLAKEAGVEVIVKNGRTLWDSDEIVKANGGKPTMSMFVESPVSCFGEAFEANSCTEPSFKLQAPKLEISRNLCQLQRVCRIQETRLSNSIIPSPTRSQT
jgi:deoxyribodipyrimidine photolyase